jgi:hypothetical protein
MSPKPTSGTSTPTEGVKPTGEAANAKSAEYKAPPENQPATGQGTLFEEKKPTFGDLQGQKEEFRVKKEAAHKELSDAWNDLQTVGIVSDPQRQAEKQARLYKAMVDTAKVHIEEGIKTAEEFARVAGLKMNDAVRQAWEEAIGKAKVTGYENIPDKVKELLPDSYWGWSPEQTESVARLNQTASKFKETWEKIAPSVSVMIDASVELANATGAFEYDNMGLGG